MVILLILAYSAVAVYQINSLSKKKYWRDLVAFSALSVISFIVSLLFCVGVKLPNSVDALHNMLEWLGLHY